MGTYRSDITQIPMDSFGGVQERCSQTQTLHRRHRFHTYEATFADTAYEELPTGFIRRHYRFDGPHQAILSYRIDLI
jgi:hypothetical protein